MKYLSLLMLLATATSLADDRPVPVYAEPRHRLVFDDQVMRVLNLLLPPGETTRFHTHDQPIVYITLSDARVRARSPGGDWVTDERPLEPRGSVLTNINYLERPETHQVSNVGETDLHLVLVLNERSGAAAPGLDVYRHLPGAPGIDNRYFAQSRIGLAPGESLDWAGVRSQLVLVLVSDTHVVIRTHTDHPVLHGMTDAGNFVTLNGDGGLSFDNRSDKAATIIAVAVL